MNLWVRSMRRVISIIVCLVTVVGCGGKIGYGVILWSNQEGLQSGEVVKVLEESRLRGTYIVRGMKGKTRYELETWRFELFEKRKDTEDFLKEYRPYINAFAISQRGGLPVREDPNSTAKRIYRLRKGQEVKVLSRGEPEEVGRFTGRWYHVLTEDGAQGYVFDAYLVTYALGQSQEVQVEARPRKEDPQLDLLLTADWSPLFFQEMIDKGQVDLASFRPEYGLIIDTEAKTIQVKTPARSIGKSYQSISRIASGRYSFGGTSFQVTLREDRIATVRYAYEGHDVIDRFVILSEDIEEVIEKENKRRERLTKALAERGEMGSEIYGVIEITPSGRFTWLNKAAIIGQGLLSPSVGNSGYVSFGNFPSAQIRSRYEGAVTFTFESGEVLNFLYTLRPGGVNFLYAEDRYIEKGVVRNDQFLNPIQMFFTSRG